MKLLALFFLLLSLTFAETHIVVEDPWVRAVPPVSTMSAAFMKIKNTGKEEDYLVGVKSSVSKTAEIHTTIMEDGLMKMRQLKEVRIPPGESVEFKPMGKHIMLIDLNKPLRAGDKVKLILIFKKSGEITVTAPVKSMDVNH